MYPICAICKDEEILTYIFNKGTLIKTNTLQIDFESRVRKIPVQDMKNFLLTKAIEKENIDISMEREFAEHVDKPVCIEYTVTFYNLEEDLMENIKVALDDLDESDLFYFNEETLKLGLRGQLKL